MSEPNKSEQARGLQERTSQFIRSLVSYRPKALGRDENRSSEVAECPQNLRPARPVERTRNNQRRQYLVALPGRPQMATGSYRGSHRVERTPRPDEQRNSRVGHHHTTDQRRDHSDRR